MERTTLREAVDAFAASARTALQCIAQIEVLNSGWQLGIQNSLRIVTRGSPPDVVILRRPDRVPFLQLKISIEYNVFFDPGSRGRRLYRVVVTRYMYLVFDLNGRELFAFHWHPVGVSGVRIPHLHVSAARPVSLPVRLGSVEAAEIDLGRLHFPTHHVELPEFVGFLIRELGVGPRRSDWERILERLSR